MSTSCGRCAATSSSRFRTSARCGVDPAAARGWWHGLKLWGSNVPGILTAGTFYQQNRIVFYDVHDPERTVVLDLDHEHYDRLIVEVEDPERAREMVERALEVKAGR